MLPNGHMKRGDVVVIPFSCQDRPGERIRPALVVQNDADNQRLSNTVVAMITGNLADQGQPTTICIDPSKPEGAGSGLHGPSLLKCYQLATVRQQSIIKVLGSVPSKTMQKVDQCLREALGTH